MPARSWRSVCGFPVLDPRDSKIVKVANIVVEWLDATYTAFKVPIGVAVYQDCGVLGILTACDIIAGQESPNSAMQEFLPHGG